MRLPIGDLPGGDGITSTSSDGLKVVPSGTDPVTGDPAFAFSTGQQSSGGTGDADRMKWLAWPRHFSSTGTPGYDTPETGAMTCTTAMSVRTRATERHPFGGAVANPRTDPRLASGAMVAADLQSGVILGFLITDYKAYALYERIRVPGSTYAAYTYAVPVATFAKGTSLTYQVVLDRSRSRATWKINGSGVLTVNAIGHRALDRRYLMVDHGGTAETVVPNQLNCGVGTFTVLDGAGSDGRGLVRLDSDKAYYAPREGEPVPQTFTDDTSLPASRLWGQGAELQVVSQQITVG